VANFDLIYSPANHFDRAPARALEKHYDEWVGSPPYPIAMEELERESALENGSECLCLRHCRQCSELKWAEDSTRRLAVCDKQQDVDYSCPRCELSAAVAITTADGNEISTHLYGSNGRAATTEEYDAKIDIVAVDHFAKKSISYNECIDNLTDLEKVVLSPLFFTAQTYQVKKSTQRFAIGHNGIYVRDIQSFVNDIADVLPARGSSDLPFDAPCRQIDWSIPVKVEMSARVPKPKVQQMSDEFFPI